MNRCKCRVFCYVKISYFRTRLRQKAEVDQGNFSGTMAEWLGSALQKLLQQFESVWYLRCPSRLKPGRDFFYAHKTRRRLYPVLVGTTAQEKAIPEKAVHRAAPGRIDRRRPAGQFFIRLV